VYQSAYTTCGVVPTNFSYIVKTTNPPLIFYVYVVGGGVLVPEGGGVVELTLELALEFEGINGYNKASAN